MAVATAMKAPMKSPVKTAVKTTSKTVVKIKPALARLKDVAHFICASSDWRISQLELHKILYLAQMIHLGQDKGVPLFYDDFEAWKYGPVVPEMYQMVKHLGADAIPADTFSHVQEIGRDHPLYEFLDEVGEGLVPMHGWQLGYLTRDEDGAWGKYYKPHVRGIVIPKEAMIDEYKTRFSEE